MKNVRRCFFIVLMLGVVIASIPARGQEKDLRVNAAVTAHIRAFDQEFFKGFDVYSAGMLDAPTALLFEIKGDNYNLSSSHWGKPLSEAEIILAIHNLNDQQVNNKEVIPFQPRALNIVNVSGKVVGYVFTSIASVSMDRKKDGSVTVYPPSQIPLMPPML
jgi:hypothetical protein